MILDSLEILRSLVAFPTVSRDSNLGLIDWIRNYLADLHVESHLVPNAEGTKSNLFATVGPAAPGGMVLSGHTDVVPIDGQTWASDPFRLTVRGSRLHGRGACDMKGFIAAVLSRLPAWKQAHLQRPVHLMFSYDEEVGCLGVSSMIAVARELLQQPGTVLVGEPTGMRIATRHKGICMAQTKVVGVEAHSSLTHRGESAVMLAGELIAHLAVTARKLAAESTGAGNEVDPPYTTVSVNRISGGTANNILAGLCEFIWDIRPIPGESADLILTELASRAEARLAHLAAAGRQCHIETTVLADVPALQTESAGVAADIVRAAIGDRKPDIAVPFGSEAGYFQRAGWSTVVCGPGDIDQAHRPDEFIEHGQLLECEALLDRLAKRLKN